MHLPSTIVFFDLETGGLELEHPVIQIAAIAVQRGWREVETFQRKIQFAVHRCTTQALEVNSYDEETWAREAIPPLQAVTEFAAFLSKYKTVEFTSKRTGKPYKVARLAGYNSQTFDQPRILGLFKQCGQFFPADPRTLDVFQLALWALAFDGVTLADYKLGTVAKHLGLATDGLHDAMADVRLTIEVAKRIRLGRSTPDPLTLSQELSAEGLV